MPSQSSQPPWLICVDTGGTFTDCLARDPAGSLHRAKVLSSSALRASVIRTEMPDRIAIAEQWNTCNDFIVGFQARRLDTGEDLGAVVSYDAERSTIRLHRRGAGMALPPGTLLEMRSAEPAPVLAARLVTSTPAQVPLPPVQMRLATTRGTNALLQRAGAPVALVTTEGFADLLEIDDQARPDIFALDIIRPPPLCRHVIEAAERLRADGTVLRPLDECRLREAARRVRDEHDVRSAAVALMHASVNPAHEQRVAAILRECGFAHVSVSSTLAPLIRILPRAQTAVVDAYLGPVVGVYLQSVSEHVGGRPRQGFHVMTSAGSLNSAASFRACESLLSGPAGGVIGAAAAARDAGFARVIGLDMGGTSTDVCRCDGALDYRFEHSVGDARLLAPALAIETVASGGGSVCDFVDGRLTVGPHSAGADPGPACYGMGGPLTITDVNLLLGRLSVEQFEIPLSRTKAEAALARLMERIKATAQSSPATDQILTGFLDIANQRMADAIEQVSLRQGYDVREYALLAFGGAGGQHACAIAGHLGIETIIFPADASLLSASGLMAAHIERIAQKQVLRPLDSCRELLAEWIEETAHEAEAAVRAEVAPADAVEVHRVIVDVRLAGQDSTIQIDLDPHDRRDIATSIRARFGTRYAEVYGHAPPLERKPMEIESLRAMARAKSAAPRTALKRTHSTSVRPLGLQRVYIGGAWREVPALVREEQSSGTVVNGPAIIVERRSSCVIEQGWQARRDDAGAIIVRRLPGAAVPSSRKSADVVRIELFSHRFMSIAADMGQLLQRTAISTNVKERLDFSCTVLDAQGELIANAPHLPVHLGAMGVCVRAVRDAITMEPGDVIITNHPAFGGSHLPDITLISPVFDADMRLIGHVANRAHHAEVGGTRPGSMPPSATSLAEEGIVIPPMHLIHAGVPRWDAIEGLLRGGRWPSRAPDDNLADLQAQVAANSRGVSALRQLAAAHGSGEVQSMMRALSERAARLAAEAIDRLARNVLEAHECLDDGCALQVRIDLTRRPVVIDFEGTAPQHAGNLNATPAIVRSAIIYVLRLLVGESLPLNEGLMRGIDVRLPHGSLLSPRFDLDDATRCAAVVGGNTEVSQRLVDTLLKAFGLSACSQGTMNNTLFGTDRFGYYETVCGGAGATSRRGGASAVHTHMTNTRITDPEIIEHRYPVRLERFAVRRGSGGRGAHCGGDGAIREITFLEPMALSVLGQHRVVAPYGSAGGQDGHTARQRLIRADGSERTLASSDAADVAAGDRLILETPGGGGWGAPPIGENTESSTPCP